MTPLPEYLHIFPINYQPKAPLIFISSAGIAQSVQTLVTGWITRA
jgi:hypothetical protein